MRYDDMRYNRMESVDRPAPTSGGGGSSTGSVTALTAPPLPSAPVAAAGVIYMGPIDIGSARVTTPTLTLGRSPITTLRRIDSILSNSATTCAGAGCR